MNFYIVIPARFKSTRLPGKPLRDIVGKPMIQRVYEQCQLAGATRVIVATDDDRILDRVQDFGGDAMMTSDSHQSGTDRLQEVAEKCGLADDAILVNVQGDEPLIPPAVIVQVAENLANNAEAAVATLVEPIEDPRDFSNPNVVKAVSDCNGMALYFSRAPIPYPRDHFLANRPGFPPGFTAERHIGIYAYRVAQLNRFVRWPVAPIEQHESLEQLRFLWNGERVHIEQSVAKVPGGVDTEADLERVIEVIREQSRGGILDV